MLPQQVTQWQTLWQCKQQQRLPHALLFVGEAGVGKKQFARTFANVILCERPSESGVQCDDCHACHLMRAHSHPDFLVVEPLPNKQTISVDQIRDVVTFVNETTLKGGFRVIMIDPAAAMNINAANALLKTLEEPTPNTLIILISDLSLRLPATILSRCQKMVFTSHAPLPVDPDKLASRQTVYQGLDLLRQGKVDPLQLALQWQDMEMLQVIDWLVLLCMAILRYQLAGDEARDEGALVMHFSSIMSRFNLLSYLDHLQQIRKDILAAIHLNKQLVLEDLLIRWIQNVSR